MNRPQGNRRPARPTPPGRRQRRRRRRKPPSKARQPRYATARAGGRGALPARFERASRRSAAVGRPMISRRAQSRMRAWPFTLNVPRFRRRRRAHLTVVVPLSSSRPWARWSTTNPAGVSSALNEARSPRRAVFDLCALPRSDHRCADARRRKIAAVRSRDSADRAVGLRCSPARRSRYRARFSALQTDRAAGRDADLLQRRSQAAPMYGDCRCAGHRRADDGQDQADDVGQWPSWSRPATLEIGTAADRGHSPDRAPTWLSPLPRLSCSTVISYAAGDAAPVLREPTAHVSDRLYITTGGPNHARQAARTPR